MNPSLNDIADVGQKLLRQAARHQVSAVREYGEALERYSSGKMGTGEFAKGALKLGWRETVGFYEGAFRAGADYYSWLFSLAGVRFTDPTKHSAAAHDEPAPAAPTIVRRRRAKG